MTDKKDANDFDFEDSDDFDFSDSVLSKDFNKEDELVDQKHLNDDFDFGDEVVRPVGENVIKRQNTINEKEVERRAVAQAQYNQFKQILDDTHEPSSSSGGSNILYQLADEMRLLNGKTFWSYAQAEGRRTKMEEIQYCTWAVLEISKAPIEDRLKVLIMEAINSYIGEMAHGKISWRIALSL